MTTGSYINIYYSLNKNLIYVEYDITLTNNLSANQYIFVVPNNTIPALYRPKQLTVFKAVNIIANYYYSASIIITTEGGIYITNEGNNGSKFYTKGTGLYLIR